MLGVIRESCLGFGPPQFFVLSESSVLGFRSVMDIFIIIIILIVLILFILLILLI